MMRLGGIVRMSERTTLSRRVLLSVSNVRRDTNRGQPMPPPAQCRRRDSRWVVFVCLTSLLLPITALAGTASELYLTAGDQMKLFVVQGSNVLRSWDEVNSEEYALAVLGTVRTTVGATGFPGHEYTLDGTYTGVTYAFPNLPGTAVYDGGSDGTYIYAWDSIQNRALRFDSNWNNPLALFSIGGSEFDFLGITYEPQNNSLWISGWEKSEVRDYSMTGLLLSSFAVSHNVNGALALDPATDTLWMGNQNALGQFEEYSKAGVLLSTQYYPELSGMNILGAEFQVPEPATWSLLALGAVALLGTRCPRRRMSVE